jgi:hypothetical protein
MAITYATTQECWNNAVGNDTVPSADTLPSANSIDRFRSNAKSQIFRIIQTMVDIDEIAKGVELELTKIEINNIINKTNFLSVINEDQINRLIFAFNVGPAIGNYRSNDDGAITG